MNRDHVLAALRRHRQEIAQRFAIQHLSVFRLEFRELCLSICFVHLETA